MRALAVLSMHTSPMAQPGTGDGGGMNVYVRELATSLARRGVRCDVYTRADNEADPPIVRVEPGLYVHRVPAGPLSPVPKEQLPSLVEEFTDAVLARMSAGHPADAIHANYWLSGVAGHRMKHDLDVPLVSTFHTLDRVKAEAELGESGEERALAEAAVIGCSDAILASCDDEVAQLRRLYDADPGRIEIVPLGVDHAFFAPGDRRQARRAIGFPEDARLLLAVGRIQPLKGLDVAVKAFAELAPSRSDAALAVVGGPSGPHGEGELRRLKGLAADFGVEDRVRFVPPQRHELLSTFYRAADVCLVPSRSESFGLVALEAAACGTPVVASAVGGLTTLVEDRRTGFLVDDRDPSVFAERAALVLDDPERAATMGRRAAVRARSYSWTTAAQRLERLYGELTARALVECR
ncbi:MAG TPA: glycosyltransferase [Acidimicrobiales bacterium]|nr:glycosyltransferase [Acidimicrobiales bacterium]